MSKNAFITRFAAVARGQGGWSVRGVRAVFHVRTYIYIHTYTYTYTYIHIYIYAYIHIYIYTYTYTYIHIHIHIQVHIHAHIHIHKYIYTYMHIYIYASPPPGTYLLTLFRGSEGLCCMQSSCYLCLCSSNVENCRSKILQFSSNHHDASPSVSQFKSHLTCTAFLKCCLTYYII